MDSNRKSKFVRLVRLAARSATATWSVLDGCLWQAVCSWATKHVHSWREQGRFRYRRTSAIRCAHNCDSNLGLACGLPLGLHTTAVCHLKSMAPRMNLSLRNNTVHASSTG